MLHTHEVAGSSPAPPTILVVRSAPMRPLWEPSPFGGFPSGRRHGTAVRGGRGLGPLELLNQLVKHPLRLLGDLLGHLRLDVGLHRLRLGVVEHVGFDLSYEV